MESDGWPSGQQTAQSIVESLEVTFVTAKCLQIHSVAFELFVLTSSIKLNLMRRRKLSAKTKIRQKACLLSHLEVASCHLLVKSIYEGPYWLL